MPQVGRPTRRLITGAGGNKELVVPRFELRAIAGPDSGAVASAAEGRLSGGNRYRLREGG
jgi:hypothetical protein